MKDKLKHIINECVKSVVNESINDNLHQFIKYIESSGTYGTLKSGCDDIAYLLRDIEDTNNLSYNVSSMLSDEFNDYCFRNGDEDDEDDEDDRYSRQELFIRERLYKTGKSILDRLQTNDNGLIYIERNIKVPNLLSVGQLGYELFDKYGGHLGIYWSYLFGQVINGWSGVEISFKGWVRPEDIDWEATVSANIEFPDEYEITLDYGVPIQVDKINIVSRRGDRTIWNKPIILKA